MTPQEIKYWRLAHDRDFLDAQLYKQARQVEAMITELQNTRKPVVGLHALSAEDCALLWDIGIRVEEDMCT